jgi:hypothetical protein
MRKMTEIEKKTKAGQSLDKDELIFLYEINNKIESFGYQKDPRITELRANRNPKEDMPIIFDCKPEQIATDVNELNEGTKAYIGKWNVEIYNKLSKYPNIKHLYESFPDKKIFIRTIEIDPTIDSPEKAEEALKQNGMNISGFGKDILYKTEFSGKKESYKLVKFTVAELGFPYGATTDEIFKRAEELGLELCPAEVGPQLRLQYKDQPNNEWLRIAMKQIIDRDGSLDIWNVRRNDGGSLWLNDRDARPTGHWGSDNCWVFCSRK